MMIATHKGVDGTEGLGRSFLRDFRSPDHCWRIEVFGTNRYCQFPYPYADCSDGWGCGFGFGASPVEPEQITVRWDLPNESRGVFVAARCWSIYTFRPALRMHQRRVHSRSGGHAQPYTVEDIRFICAKRRGQRKGTKGFVVEE
jgi:hypothetical protein